MDNQNPMMGDSQSPQSHQSSPEQSSQQVQAPMTAPAVGVPAMPNFATFGNRFVAWLIDMLIIIVIIFGIGIVLGILAVATLGAEGAKDNEVFSRIGNLLGLLVSWVYFAYTESSEAQASLGKRAMGIKVVDLQGNRISMGKAFLRAVGKTVSGAIFAIGYLLMLFTEKKQTLHDLIAGTLVVKK